MFRYVTILPTERRSSDYYYPDDHRTMTVYEADSDAQDTGLLDQHGTKLWRVASRAVCGFRGG